MGQISVSPSSITAVPTPKKDCRSYAPGHGLPAAVGMNAHCLAWVPAQIREVRANRVRLLTPSGYAYYFNHDAERLRWFEKLADGLEDSADAGEGLVWNEGQSLLGYRHVDEEGRTGTYLLRLSPSPLGPCDILLDSAGAVAQRTGETEA